MIQKENDMKRLNRTHEISLKKDISACQGLDYVPMSQGSERKLGREDAHRSMIPSIHAWSAAGPQLRIHVCERARAVNQCEDDAS